MIFVSLTIIGLISAPKIIEKLKEIDWDSPKVIVCYLIIAMVVAMLLLVLLFSRAFRTRTRVEKNTRDDPDLHDWLIVYDLDEMALFYPTIIASLLAAAITYFELINPGIVGTFWFLIALFNFLMYKYVIGIKMLLISFFSFSLTIAFLIFLGFFVGALRKLTHLEIYASPLLYLLFVIVSLTSIFISWLKGLFYYLAFLPNYLNIQEGASEEGDQIDRSDFNTKVDTSDITLRRLGFGWIEVYFKERNRMPIRILVWNIKKKARYLEKVRGKLAIDLHK